MGSPISVIVGNLVMEFIENKMLKDFASPPRIWLRYIDDTFVVLKKTEVVSFHKFINNIEESIKFTVEQEVDKNDYPDWLLNKMKKEIKHKKVNKSVCMSEKISNYVCLPYIKGLSHEMARILRKFNINVYTYPYKIIGNILPKIKDSVDDIYKRGAIYKIPCKDCSNVYVGETGRCFNTRLSEHNVI